MEAVNGTGAIVPEPDWALLLDDPLEIEAAREYWRRITTEMRERDTLSPTNGHAIQRLITAYLVFDQNSRTVLGNGAVTKPKRGSPRAIARTSPHFAVMREAGSDADRQEQELGLAPRRRASVAKVEKRKEARRTGADRYLKPVAK